MSLNLLTEIVVRFLLFFAFVSVAILVVVRQVRSEKTPEPSLDLWGRLANAAEEDDAAA